MLGRGDACADDTPLISTSRVFGSQKIMVSFDAFVRLAVGYGGSGATFFWPVSSARLGLLGFDGMLHEEGDGAGGGLHRPHDAHDADSLEAAGA